MVTSSKGVVWTGKGHEDAHWVAEKYSPFSSGWWSLGCVHLEKSIRHVGLVQAMNFAIHVYPSIEKRQNGEGEGLQLAQLVGEQCS